MALVELGAPIRLKVSMQIRDVVGKQVAAHGVPLVMAQPCNTIVIAASRRVVFATDTDAPQCSVSTTVERVFRVTCVDGASITEAKLAGVAAITAQPGGRSHASTQSYATIGHTACARVRSDTCPKAKVSTAVVMWRVTVAAP